MTTDVIVLVQPEQVVVNTRDKVTVIESSSAPVVISQLSEGPQGPPGPPGDASGALLISNALSELATDPDTQVRAQTNLGLGNIDPLAYYILAKS